MSNSHKQKKFLNPTNSLFVTCVILITIVDTFSHVVPMKTSMVCALATIIKQLMPSHTHTHIAPIPLQDISHLSGQVYMKISIPKILSHLGSSHAHPTSRMVDSSQDSAHKLYTLKANHLWTLCHSPPPPKTNIPIH